MTKTFDIAAFGALNGDSYDMFAEQLMLQAKEKGMEVKLTLAGPYPNAEAISAPGRPLRAEAQQDEAKRQQLFAAVAADAKEAGAEKADILCMPCMSMIGFHDGVEQALGYGIVRLADALKAKYKDIDKVGVIHMRPAKKSIESIFGYKAVLPDEAQAAKLLTAEEAAKKIKDAAPVETVMKEITEAWRDQGIKQVLFARADAPKAQKGAAGQVSGIDIASTFDVLAEFIIDTHK